MTPPTHWLLAAGFCLLSTLSIAQIKINDPAKAAQRSLESRTSSKINQTAERNTSRTLDKAEKDVTEGVKKKTKKEKNKDKKAEKDATAPTTGEITLGSSASSAAPEKTAEPTEKKRSKRQRKADEAAAKATTPTRQPVSMRAYSLFDFVPAQTVVAVDDFGTDATGRYPTRWNTNGGGEVVTLAGQPGKWLAITQNGQFYPEYLNALPDYFTLEMDMAVTDRVNNAGVGAVLRFVDSKANANLLQPNHAAEVRLALQPGSETTSVTAWNPDQTERVSNRNALRNWNGTTQPMARLSVWRQNMRLSVYLNEVKIWDIPRAFVPGVAYRVVLERDFVNAEKQAWCIGNMRVAVGAPYIRSKFTNEGRFSTTGILFEAGTDLIRPESYGVLKEISGLLTSKATTRMQIVGHTDADGDDAKNLDLSKRRAAAVRTALVTEFGVDAGRMDTDGKGETQPATNNSTPEGKANNRRIEFVKL